MGVSIRIDMIIHARPCPSLPALARYVALNAVLNGQPYKPPVAFQHTVSEPPTPRAVVFNGYNTIINYFLAVVSNYSLRYSENSLF